MDGDWYTAEQEIRARHAEARAAATIRWLREENAATSPPANPIQTVIAALRRWLSARAPWHHRPAFRRET